MTGCDQIRIFEQRAEARAILAANGIISLQDAVDELQHAAVRSGLVDHIGQDAVQAIMAFAFELWRALPC